VLYVDGENPDYVVKKRLAHLGIPETDNLKIWGHWQSEPPPGPDHPLIQKFAADEKPLLIWDSLIEFHPGEEQSATETRRYMKKYRHLAGLGATVLLLHHTGKGETSQEFRGSSDIKAAVDMSFLLTRPDKRMSKAIDVLRLEPKKCRLAVLATRDIKLVEGKGFESSGTVVEEVMDPARVLEEIVAREPGLNQGDVVKRAASQHVPKHTAEEILKRRDLFRMEKGNGRAQLYYPVGDAPATEAIPAPPPAEEVPAPAEAARAHAEVPAGEPPEQQAA
jgi:hypothetical protein